MLEKYGVEMIGANAQAIAKAEERDQFKVAMEEIGLEVCNGETVHGIEEAREAIGRIGLPCVVRPSFTLGSWMFVDSPIPELRVPWAVFLPTSLTLAAVCIFVVRLAVNAQRSPIDTGQEGLAGEIGRVTSSLDPEGKVFVHGELWNAASASGPIAEGTRIRVVQVKEMQLTVEPAEKRS